MAYVEVNTPIEFGVDCPSPTPGGPTTSECGTYKTITWAGAGLQTQYFYVQNVNQQLVSFQFSGITNPGPSSITVDVVYKRNGITVTAETFNLGAIVSNTKKYHFVDFGNTVPPDGIIYLKYNISGGSSGSMDNFLDCSVLVGSRLFCYKTLPAAARDLCTKCQSTIRLYFERTSLFNFQNFTYGLWYTDPLLSSVAANGYYVPFDSTNPKSIYVFTGTSATIAHSCDPQTLDCDGILTQSHVVATDYKFNSPYPPNTPGVTLSGLKYSIKNYFVDFPNTNYGWVTLTVSNNGTYQKEIVFSVSDINALAGQSGSITYSETTPGTTEFFRALTPFNLFKVPANSSKTIYLIINGNPNQLTKRLKVSVAVGLNKKYNNNAAPNINTTVTMSCVNTIYSASTGLHAYSAYDAANTPKCTTTLYSFVAPASWGINSRVWHDAYFINPALPYFYNYGSKVFKVGQPFRREFGIKYYYQVKTSVIRKLGVALGLTKKPVTVNQKILGPKDWQTLTQVPACIEPSMLDIGLIKQQFNVGSLPVPTTYLYLTGKDNSSKIVANDSVFTQYDYNTSTHKPITGFIHAIDKIVAAYVKASTDADIRKNIGGLWTPYAIAGLGLLGAVIAVAPLTFGTIFVNTALLMVSCPWAVGVSAALSGTGIGALVVIAILIILLLFVPIKKDLEEDCKLFDKVYTNNDYLEQSNTIYTNSGMTTAASTQYYTDGGYFYTLSSGVITSKEGPSYTNMDGARKYSLTPDNPTFITSIQNFYLLPYVSGRPIVWTTPLFKNAAQSKSIVPGTVMGALNTPSTVTYDVPEGLFEADTQEEADALATNYINSLTAHTEDIYSSSEPLATASGLTMFFSHEIKIETKPSIIPIFFNASGLTTLTTGTTLYYDTNGLFSVLDGYYSLSGESGNFRTFYKTSAGTVVDYYNMPTSVSTTVTSPTSGSLPVITSGQSFTSNWFFFGPTVSDVMFDDTNNIHDFNNNWNNNTFYSSEYVRRGMLQSPDTQNFYIFSSNTSGNSYGNAPEGWYRDIPNISSVDPFLIQSAITINLNSIQNCSDDDENGIYVTCVDTTGNIIPSFYGVSGQLTVGTSTGDTYHDFTIAEDDYRVLVPLDSSYIGIITGATVVVTSANPISGITFGNGSFTGCVTPTPTPTPEYNPCSCYNITFDGNITHASLTAYWTDCNGTPMSQFVVADTTYGPVCAQAGSAYGQAFTIGACCDVTPTPTPTPTLTPTPSEATSTTLDIYARYVGGTPPSSFDELQYQVNGTGGSWLSFGVQISSSSCLYFTTISTGINAGDTVYFQTLNTSALSGDLSSCPGSASCGTPSILLSSGSNTIYISTDPNISC